MLVGSHLSGITGKFINRIVTDNGMIGLVTAVSKDGIRVKGNGESQDFLLETEEWTLALKEN